MSHSFTSIHIVPKLNQVTHAVEGIIKQVREVAFKHNVREVTQEQIEPYTLVIAVGGDGTMLEAMKRAHKAGALVIGIHAGNVGFLTEFSNDACLPAILTELMQLVVDDDLINNKNSSFVVEHRFMVRTHLPNGEAILGMNEVSIAGAYSDQMINYHLGISPRGVGWLSDAGVHKANTIMVSTPTGSTAYSMSAGGALMTPDLRAMQIVPVAPHTLTSRPIITSGHSTIQVSAWGAPIALRVDGTTRLLTESFHHQHDPLVVKILMDQTPVNVLHLRMWNFYGVLTNKLGWNT